MAGRKFDCELVGGDITGRNGRPVDSPSPHTQAAMEADAKAFTAVMGHLKEADPQHTVLMV